MQILNAFGYVLTLFVPTRAISFLANTVDEGEQRDPEASRADCIRQYPNDSVVLLWSSGIFSAEKDYHVYSDKECDVKCIEGPVSKECSGRADAIVDHLPTLYWRLQNNEIREIRSSKRPGQFGIGFSMEAEGSYPFERPSRSKSMGWDALATTDPLAEVPVAYFSLQDVNGTKSQVSPAWEDRMPQALFLASNCGTSLGAHTRSQFVTRLAQAGVPIFSLGACCPAGTSCKHNSVFEAAPKSELVGQFRVYLALENFEEPGYVSEKVLDAFSAGAVPVYLGAPDIADIVPATSIIRVSNDMDDEALKRIAGTINAALNNKTEWNSLMRWRTEPMESWNNGQLYERWGGKPELPPRGRAAAASCRMCRMVYAQKHVHEVAFHTQTQELQALAKEDAPQ